MLPPGVYLSKVDTHMFFRAVSSLPTSQDLYTVSSLFSASKNFCFPLLYGFVVSSALKPDGSSGFMILSNLEAALASCTFHAMPPHKRDSSITSVTIPEPNLLRFFR